MEQSDNVILVAEQFSGKIHCCLHVLTVRNECCPFLPLLVSLQILFLTDDYPITNDGKSICFGE